MDESGNGYARPEDLRRHEEDVVVGCGKFRVRALDVGELLMARGVLIDLVAAATGGEDKIKAAIRPEHGAAIERVVLKGVVIPRLHEDPAQGATIAGIPPLDVVTLFSKIMALSGAGPGAGKDLVPS